ncbi:MAG: BON domain-containing protein, partial [Agriterribacter sp.]
IRDCETTGLKLLPTAYKTDQEVIAAIHKALEWYPGAKQNQIQIDVHNGNVVLGGVVDLEYKRGTIERAVEALEGVRSVVNRIKV